MIDSAANEKSVFELRHLHGNQGLVMSGITEGIVELEEFSEGSGYVKIGREKRWGGEMECLGMNKFYTGIVAEYVDVALGVGLKTASERREMGKSCREGDLEVGKKIGGGFKRGLG